MIYKTTIKFLISFILLTFSSYGQRDQISIKADSLYQEAQSAKDINLKIHLFTLSGSYFIRSNPQKALEYFQEAQDLLSENTPDSLRYNLIYRTASAYEHTTSNSKKAAEYYNQALKLAENNNDSAGISTVYLQLGILNFYQGDLQLAENYFTKSYQNCPSDSDPIKRSKIVTALGVIYTNNEDFEKADSVMKIGRHIYLTNHDTVNAAVATSNIAEIKWELNQKDSAYRYLNEALQYNKDYSDDLGMAWCYYLLGTFKMDEKEWEKADNAMGKAIQIWEDIDSRKDLVYGYKDYAEIKASLNDYESAYTINLKLQVVKDSIFKKENIQHLQELEKKYESEKDSIQIASMGVQLAQEKKLNGLERKAKYRLIIFFVVIGIILIFNIIYFYFRFRSTQKAKSIIELQKSILEEKNREITDSITYAKRIQNALIPGQKKVKKIFPKSFIFYEPKDIVAGDFYWVETVDDIDFCAVADCTGHGVPGAMVSVVCANALNKTILEEKIVDPAKALDRVRHIVKTYFDQGEDIKDGMDIALVAIKKEPDNTQKVAFAGANNPLWYITSESPQEIIEVKGDKQPIGAFQNETPFTTHYINLSSNDRIYLFTDGFVDQFGGEKGKKLKANNFKKLILSVQTKEIEQQKNEFNTSFEHWKGELEQLDDVCIMGIEL